MGVLLQSFATKGTLVRNLYCIQMLPCMPGYNEIHISMTLCPMGYIEHVTYYIEQHLLDHIYLTPNNYNKRPHKLLPLASIAGHRQLTKYLSKPHASA